MPRRRTAVIATIAAAVVAAAGIGADRVEPEASGTYVAMGDSYSSGDGIHPLAGMPDPRCRRSTLNYAHLIEQRARVGTLVDVTCSGAETRHFESAQHPNVPPQLEALSSRTTLITMTIGANDRQVFGRSINTCVAVSRTDPAGNPCQRRFGATFRRDITRHTRPDVAQALRQVHRAAPKARVVVLGYPRIFPATGSAGCTEATRIAQDDVPYLNSVLRQLNRAIRSSATRARATYVDLWAASEGHDACQPPERRWVEPFVPVDAAPFHPNARGEAAMATAVIRSIRPPSS